VHVLGATHILPPVAGDAAHFPSVPPVVDDVAHVLGATHILPPVAGDAAYFLGVPLVAGDAALLLGATHTWALRQKADSTTARRLPVIDDHDVLAAYASSAAGVFERAT
jgi:hypothetical protein